MVAGAAALVIALALVSIAIAVMDNDDSDPAVETAAPNDGTALVNDFRDVLATTPAWTTVRRPIPDINELRNDTSAWFIGTLTAVERGSVIQERVDPEPELSAVFERAHIDLVFIVESANRGAGLEPGDVVAVPFVVWYAGAGAPHLDQEMSSILTRLQETIPSDLRGLVYLHEIEPSGSGAERAHAQLPTEGPPGFPSPAAITFEESASNLQSLDWTVADAAEEYLAAATLEEAAQAVATD